VFGKRLFRAKTGRAKLPLSRFYTVWRLGGSLALPGFRVSKHALSLSVSVAALAPAADVTEAVRYWFDINGVPDSPKPPRTWEAASALVARGLIETGWDAEKKGWHNALSDPWGAAYNGGIALDLRYFAQAHPNDPLAPRIGAQLQEAFAAAPSGRGFDFAFHEGNAAETVANEASAGLRDALAMPQDGAYAFHPHTGNKMFSQAQSKSLGQDGEVVVGTCVMGLEPLARRALLTGDALLVSSLEKGLAHLDQYVRPQGAEHWEVPLACPNLRALALATRCYLYGYQLTGKQHYLDKARFWAITGLPFLYTWNAADRPVMRYASISVMGTSLHTGTWFGHPVQWVGLVYADAIRELAAIDDSFPWTKAAEGILISAMQQQKTAGAPCGHVGFYPDSYSTLLEDETYHWCLAPTLLAEVLNALKGVDPRASATVVRTGDRTVHLIAPGKISDASYESNALHFTSLYLVGATHEVVVARVIGAADVLVDGAKLPPVDLKADGEAGWKQAPGGFLRLRIRHAGPAVRIEIRGCVLREPGARKNLGGLANGDFEEGLAQWTPDAPDCARLVADAHSGKQALELSAVGRTDEVQCPSRPVLVEAGRAYPNSAWVKQPEGANGYKVTLDWLGEAGHIRYDNDWQGDNRPAEYTLHGGRFIAPEGARRH